MYTSGKKNNILIKELEEEVVSASYSSFPEEPDEKSTLKDLLLEEKRKNLLSLQENRCLQEKNDKIRTENEQLKFEIKNLKYVVEGLNDCITLLKERFTEKGSVVDKENEFLENSNNILKRVGEPLCEPYDDDQKREFQDKLQGRVRIYEAEILCKDCIIEDLLENDTNTKNNGKVSEKKKALEERVTSLRRENDQLCKLTEEFGRERKEWEGIKIVMTGKLKELENDCISLKETAMKLEEENKKLLAQRERDLTSD